MHLDDGRLRLRRFHDHAPASPGSLTRSGARTPRTSLARPLWLRPDAGRVCAFLTEAGCIVTVALPIDGPLVPLLQQAGAGVVIVETLVLRKSLMSPRGLITLAVDWPSFAAARDSGRALRSHPTSST